MADFEDDIDDNPFVLALAEKDPQAELVKDGAKIAKEAASGKSVGPNAKAATQVVPLSSLDTLTTKFDVTRIPLSRLKQMRRDPTLAFALFFTHAQLAKAKWKIQSTDAQQAAYADHALREVLPGLIANYVEKLTYGYQPVVMRFGVAMPDWTYSDPTDELAPEKLVWDEGSIKATILKPFVGIPPETADPIFTEKGEFDGIDYKPSLLLGGASGSGAEAQIIDVMHSIWFTNEKASVHESLWGYPRIGMAYRFWWSFWFNWGLSDRAFERLSDPAIIVHFPKGEAARDGLTPAARALRIGDRVRSNGTIALPSGLVESLNTTGTTSIQEWQVEQLKTEGNFEIFFQRFEQLQKFILRAAMVPDEGFQNTGGGTAGYNKTGQLQDTFAMSQVNLMDDLDFVINRYILPRLMAAAFGDKAVKVKKVTTGFDSFDVELAKNLLGNAANADISQLDLDIPGILDALGMPRLSLPEIRKKQAEIAAQVGAEVPPPTDAVAGKEAGVTETGLYYNPRERIELSTDKTRTDMDNLLLEELMGVGALRDPVVINDARRLATTWRQAIAADFTEATSLLNDYDGTKIDLSEGFFERFTRRVQNRAVGTVATTRRALAALMRRASTVELEKAGISEFSWDPANDQLAMNYLDERSEDLVTGITDTTRSEVRTYLADLVRQGVSKDDIPHYVRSHFMMFSQWRADRIVRTEFVNAYNRATLLAGMDAGVKQVLLIDGQYGAPRSDRHCIERSGKVIPIEAALQLTDHPNGTLQFLLLRRNVRVERLPVPRERPSDLLATEYVEQRTGDLVIQLADELEDAKAEDFIERVIQKYAEKDDPVPAVVHTGAMVALYPTPEVAAKIAVPGGMAPEEIHLTLAFLGKASDLPDGHLLQQRLQAFASQQKPLTGEIAGTGLFTAGPEPVTYVSPDVPALPAFREAIVKLLKETSTPADERHGYTPHMTIAYADRDIDPANIKLVFSQLTLVLGDERFDYNLAAV